MIRSVAFTALVAALFASFVSTPAVASERVEICAQYTATQHSYHVNAISVRGSELNSETHSFNYNSLSYYIVIFWAQDQASVIEMNSPFFGQPTPFGADGSDQQGRAWQISSYAPYVCGP
jgi:hypothetical protein